MTILPRYQGFDVAAPGANTGIMSSSLTPKMAGVFRVTIALATASVFNYTETSAGVTNTYGLNLSVPLPADDAHVFEFDVHPSYTYNFQVETDGIIQQIKVSEVYT